MSVSNVSVNEFITSGLQKVDNMGAALDARMDAISSSSEELSQEDLLQLQYEMGQYQALISALNSTVSALQSQMKEMANSIR